MYGAALPGHLGAVLTAQLLNHSSHLFESFIAFTEELLYWENVTFKKTPHS